MDTESAEETTDEPGDLLSSLDDEDEHSGTRMAMMDGKDATSNKQKQAKTGSATGVAKGSSHPLNRRVGARVTDE